MGASGNLLAYLGARLSARRRYFLAVQCGKAAFGIALCIAFVVFCGRPDLLEALALAGLALPTLLLPLTFTKIPLRPLEMSSLAAFSMVVTYLCAITGGLVSPFTIWFVLVPVEATLHADKGSVLESVELALGGVAILALLFGFDLLPASQSPVSVSVGVLVASSSAVMLTALIAATAHERQTAAQKSAAEGAAMYRFLADNAMDMITRHAADGRIRYASPAASALLGCTPSSLIGMTPAVLAHPADLPALQKVFMEASYYGRPASAEVRLKDADGRYVWAEMRCRPVPSLEGKAADIVAVTRDLTARKAYERGLIEARDLAEEANKSKSRFLANMSHELRTPLNAIIGFSEVMMREMFGPLGGPRYAEYSHLIHESGTHLLELINSILDMSKIEAGKMEISEEVFDLSEIVLASVRFVKMAADRAGVSLDVAIDPSAARIYADKRASKQIVVNLLTNGVKFTPKGGSVRVSASRKDGGIEIAVTDTGTGISPKDLERLGKPFEQVEDEHVRSKEGTGLGLALVRSLTGLHGGEMKLESVVGEGTTVRVTLPHAAVDEGAGAQSVRGAA